MKQDEHELTESEEWFRDRLKDFLGYGVAAFTRLVDLRSRSLDANGTLVSP